MEGIVNVRIICSPRSQVDIEKVDNKVRNSALCHSAQVQSDRETV